jgi:hypothetical protein
MISSRRLFGLETEYAVTAIAENGSVIPAAEFGGALIRAAERWLPSLPGSPDPGLFLGNGSRLYIDAGAHPELAGPECLDPWDAVRYLRASDRIMQRLADDVRRRNPWVVSTSVFTGNVDYAETTSTWGAHESYCHRVAPEALRSALVPHLVSRVIFCGAGGFNPRSPGLEFTLSPRAHHLNHVVSVDSTHDRGITHARDEPLAAHGYRRQHLICGESLRSDLAAWLRVGTTALVVALIDGGVACGEAVELESPVAALRLVAADPTCTRPLRLKRGGTATAIQVQRCYLAQALANLSHPVMPPWADDVCRRWADVLDRLEEGPDRVATTLDWAIKLAIYRDQVRRRGFEWETLPQALRGRGESSGQLEDMRTLRRNLLEMDARWGQLGSAGVFDGLDRAGVLQHRLAGVDRIDEAMEQPPAEGRAHVRGLVIQRVQPERAHHWCSWSEILDRKNRRRLDLADPFASAETWRAARPVGNAEPLGAPLTGPAGDDGSFFGEIREILSRVNPRGRRDRPAPRDTASS